MTEDERLDNAIRFGEEVEAIKNGPGEHYSKVKTLAKMSNESWTTDRSRSLAIMGVLVDFTSQHDIVYLLDRPILTAWNKRARANRKSLNS